MRLFNKIVLSSFAGLCVGVRIGVWVRRRWSIERHRKMMDLGREDGCGGPYLAAPPTSTRVQNRFGFVWLAREMSFNARGKFTLELQFQAGTSDDSW